MQQYKTIVLQLIRQYPQIHNHLKQTRTLPRTLNLFSMELKRKHEAWMDVLSESRSRSDPSRIASEAMEIALQDLEQLLQDELAPDGSESLTLDAAIASLRDRTQPE